MLTCCLQGPQGVEEDSQSAGETLLLCCAETHECLEEVEDCSSLGPGDEGFAVYQSPLSLAKQSLRPLPSAQCEGPCPCAAGALPLPPPPPAVLADLQPRLACDPDLEEMLRWVPSASATSDGRACCMQMDCLLRPCGAVPPCLVGKSDCNARRLPGLPTTNVH